MIEPWDQPDALTWRLYADFLSDQPAVDLDRWLRALRFSIGLTKRPKLMLMCDGERARMLVVVGALSGAIRGRNPRWVNIAYALARRPVCLSEEETIELHAATPLDFPGMTNDLTWKNAILRNFYRRASYDICLTYEDGKVWQWTTGVNKFARAIL